MNDENRQGGTFSETIFWDKKEQAPKELFALKTPILNIFFGTVTLRNFPVQWLVGT